MELNNNLLEISIIIPCLNEEQNLEPLVLKLLDLFKVNNLTSEILIVDDCSDDYTFKSAIRLEDKFANVKALHKGLPRGIGNAIKFGINHSQGKMGVVVMGDGVDPLEAIPEFYKKIVNEDYKLALLSRYLDPSDSQTIPFSYKFYQWWYRFFCRHFIGITIKDITYAYRAFDINFVKELNLESGGFEISPEITIKTFLKKAKICEVKGQQGRRVKGESKFFFSKVGLGYAKVLIEGTLARISKILFNKRK